MKLLEGGFKPVSQMSDDELAGVVSMLRSMRATALNSAKRSVTRRKKVDADPTNKAKLPKTINIEKLLATLSPEQQAAFKMLHMGL